MMIFVVSTVSDMDLHWDQGGWQAVVALHSAQVGWWWYQHCDNSPPVSRFSCVLTVTSARCVSLSSSRGSRCSRLGCPTVTDWSQAASRERGLCQLEMSEQTVSRTVIGQRGPGLSSHWRKHETEWVQVQWRRPGMDSASSQIAINVTFQQNKMKIYLERIFILWK